MGPWAACTGGELAMVDFVLVGLLVGCFCGFLWSLGVGLGIWPLAFWFERELLGFCLGVVLVAFWLGIGAVGFGLGVGSLAFDWR